MPNELLAQLGMAAPLVAVLLLLLKRQSDETKEVGNERKEITTRFLAALTSSIEQSNEVRIRSANELSQLTNVIRDHQDRSADEHQRIVDAIGKLMVRP